MLTLRYFGPFSARRDGAEVGFPTRPAARLLALLATEPGHRWRRESVAREIWPEAEWATESSSLRTALAMLRRTVGTEVVGSDRERVWIDPQTVATDLDRFDVLVRREGLETEEDGRERILSELAEASLGFLEGWEATWITHLRGEHVRTMARVTLELARARLASGQYDGARDLALRSLVARPGNDHAIAVAVRASVALGEREEALELAARLGTSDELRHLAREIAASPAASSSPSVDSSDLLFDAFESNLQEDPEGAVRFLMGNRSFWWRQREIVRAKTLLQRGLGATLSDPLRARTLHTLGMLEFRTADYEPALAAGREALALDPDSDLRNDLRMVRGATLNTLTRWEESAAEFEDHLAQMAREPRDYRTNWVLLNRAARAMCLVRFDEARRDMELAGQDFIGDEFRRRYGEAHLDQMRAEIALHEDDFTATRRYADASREMLTLRTDPYAAAVPNALSLLARAAQGETGIGPRLVGAPLDPVRLGMRGTAAVVFDRVAQGLAYLGRGNTACELFRACEVLRRTISQPQSPIESAARERAEELALARPGPSVPPAPSGSFAELAAWTARRWDDL